MSDKLLFLFLFLSLSSYSKESFLSFAEINSKKLELSLIESNVSYTNNLKWVGYELKSQHIITKISWASDDELASQDLMFGIFEGANEPNFIDSIPLYMFKEETNSKSVQIESTTPYKYIRYVSPLKKAISISNIEIFGYEAQKNEEKEEKIYQPTNIPLIVVKTEGKTNFRKKNIDTPCNVIVINNGKIEVKQTGSIRIRGNSSKDLEKKSFQLHLDEKTNILGMPAKAKKWGLLANHMDKSLIRNLVAFKISSLLGQKYSPACKSFDLILDGSFEGNYIICDKIEKGKNRVELNTMEETDNEFPNVTGGYLMEIDGFADQEQYHFTSKKGVKVTIKYPDATKNQTAYIKNWFDEIEENIYSNQNIDKIDLETFSQYFILNEFCADIDSVWSSYYVTKQRNDEKLYFGPAWDFDLSLDNDNRLYPTNSKDKWIFNYGLSAGTYRQFLSKLMGCEKALTAVQQKWKDITVNDFTKEKVFDFIEEQIKYIDESQKLNFKRWNVLNKILKYEAVARGSYEEEIKHLKEYIEERFMIFGNMILSANTSSFEIKNEGNWPGWDQGDWGNWDWSDFPWQNPGSDFPWGGGDNPWGGSDFPWGGSDFPWGGNDNPWGGNDNPWRDNNIQGGNNDN